MPLSINTFVEKFKDGFVHPNLYRVSFKGRDWIQNELLGLSCKTVKIPGVTYKTAQYVVDAVERKFVSGADLDPVEMVFIVDSSKTKGGSVIIQAFETWAAAIFKDGQFGFKDTYTVDIDIEMLNREGTTIYESTIYGAYPTVITAFDLSYETENAIMEYSITFNYHHVGDFNPKKA